MEQMVVRFDTSQGWAEIRGTNVADYLSKVTPTTTFTKIIVREGTASATVLVDEMAVERVLTAFRKGYVYTKMQQDERRNQELKILMLKDGVTHATTQDLLSEDGVLGMIKQMSGGIPRYGLRFKDAAKMHTLATKLHVADQLGSR